MISLQYFANISVQISPNNNKLDIFKIYTERAVGKCPRWNFQAYWKPRNLINKSVYSFGEHPVQMILTYQLKDNQDVCSGKELDKPRPKKKCPNAVIVITNLLQIVRMENIKLRSMDTKQNTYVSLSIFDWFSFHPLEY